MPVLSGFRFGLIAVVTLIAAPLAAQNDTAATTPPAGQSAPAPAQPLDVPPRPRVNLMVTVPRGEVNEAQLQECRDDADAGQISGEIVVCREVGNDGSNNTGNREQTQKRYAQETMLKGAPRAPEAFGIPDNGKGIGFGKAPPPALMIDVGALPKAPPGSDADRIAQGLAPLGEDRELTEEEERARREAAGIRTTAPPREKKKKGG